MNLKQLIKKERYLILNSIDKTEALLEIIEAIDNEGCIQDIENVKKEIFYREQIMSTGIGQGIGIPHIRFGSIREPLIYVGISSRGIENYDSLDKLPVHIVIMILVGEDRHKEYLRTLSLIVSRLKDASTISRLAESSTAEEVCSSLVGEDL